MENTERKQWKSKEGMVNIDEMSEEYLQNALRHAEHRFIHAHNIMMRMAEKAEIFETKMKELREEAARKNYNVKSLYEMQKGDKYDILRNTYYLAAKCADA